MAKDKVARGMAQKIELGFIIGDSAANPPFLPISIDTVARTVYIYYLFTLYSKKGKYTVPAVSPYAKSYSGSSDDIIMIYFDLSDLVVKVVNITTTPSPTNIIPITYFNGSGYLHGNSHAIKLDGAPALEMPYYAWNTSNAFVMPNNYYFIKDYTYSIASQNFNKLITTNNPNLLYEIYTDMYIERFINSAKLSFKTAGVMPSVLTGIRGGYFKNALRKELTINVTGTEKTSTTPKILCIGDSITHRQFVYFIKKWLTELGITPTFIGTMNNLTDTAETILGEGRQGWRSTDFTGVCTHNGVAFPASDAVNSLYTNPFLNGSVFDFSHYMTAQGFTGVDYVVLMMGTNDVTNYSAQGVAPTVADATIPLNVRDSLNTIIASIHAYNPNIKIAVVPPVLGGMYLEKNKLFLEVATRLIYTYDAKISNVYLIPSYLSTGIMSGKEQLPGTEFSVLDPTIKSTLPNDVHDSIGGARINALWSASWIMNMLT